MMKTSSHRSSPAESIGLVLLVLGLFSGRNVRVQGFMACDKPPFRQRPARLLSALSAEEEVSVPPQSASSTCPSSTTHPPKSLPFLAGIGFLYYGFRGQTHHYLQRLQEKHGDELIIWNKLVILTNPPAIRDVLEKHNLPKTVEVRRGYKCMFSSSGGILAAPWGNWQKQRRMTAPALSERVIGELQPKFECASRPFFDYLERHSSSKDDRRKRVTIEMDAAFVAATMDIMGEILVGQGFGMCAQLEKKGRVPFSVALDVLTREAFRQMTLPPFLLRMRKASRKVRRAKKEVDDLLEECIANRLTHPTNTTDLMNILLRAEKDDLISRNEVKAQLLTFIFAGHETTAHTLSYLLWEVSQNPELQDALAAEAKQALPNRDSFPMDPDIIAKRLPLLDRTFRETTRKHPTTATGTVRSVGKKALVVGDGLELPPRTRVLMPPWSIHRNEKYWPDPEQFDPDRFDCSNAIEPYSYQAFSGGPRNCIGERLARAETLSLLAPLFRRYEVRCESKKEPADKYSLTRKPRIGIHFTLVSRE